MKQYIVPILIVSFAFLFGCTVGFETTDPEVEFTCSDDEDCLPGFICNSAVCSRSIDGGDCEDPDGDGYGVGDSRSECPLCRDQGKCEVDCEPNDPNINPGAGELCNNIDDNCNDEIDETTMCTTSSDCGTNPADLEGDAAVPGAVWRCSNGACVAQMRRTICVGGVPDPCPCDNNPLACSNGTYPAVPDACQ